MKKRDPYAEAGVDVAKVREIQSSIAGALASTFSLRDGKIGQPLLKIGHYAGLIDIGHGDALALHTDGVGTKVLVAEALKRFDTVGIDCVAMTVNDLICVGAEPIALLDYIALQKEDDHLVSELTKGLVEGAKQASAPIVGGETAIMGNVKGFDLVSMGVGIVKKDRVLDGSLVSAGDRVIGVASSGLHSNGFTLARKVLLSGRPAGEWAEELGATLGGAMLTPTLIYVKPVLAILKRREVHGVAHVTGGSFTKLKRLLGGRKLEFALENRPAPAIFGMIQREGRLSKKEMYSTFNMGVGLCVCAPESEEGAIISTFKRMGFDAFDFGVVRRGSGVLVGKTRLAA
jgi:phosphoribosylformylglycinamidine cyclo-ligase